MEKEENLIILKDELTTICEGLVKQMDQINDEITTDGKE